jgi:hypothetical protein
MSHGVLAEDASKSENQPSAKTLEGLVSELLQFEFEGGFTVAEKG